ncbi:Malate/lactate/ureidoglycolate dehydrogenase, LDH2 family [Lentibacillus halodurans]|uniref:Malate/lactate/ureidoglycolate dehydrogenase, LDH2 family n=1 Tax=Lentibacillus halodurans TaxID=237679 RepID=A0A1I1AI97_9BACI|nr:Ldh family oxidoreductase [Lentibacillus halodurans]SFB37744.1 Malate/lactate/ureidoglycolate dehydrogenase, LDH2 family [Lentibacillus halodurans]
MPVHNNHHQELTIDEYVQKGCELLKSVSVSHKDATTMMDALLDADLRGVHTHGLFRLPRYVEQLKAESINPLPNINMVHSNPWLEVLDGDHGPGAVVADEAMHRALKKSNDYGIGVTAVHNGNHFGMAAYYAEMASQEGKIGIVMTNSSPAIAPTGSIKRLIGNNPWSVSVPNPDNQPVTLDIANSIVSKGRLRVARDQGETIPLGWALDADGKPTDDPQKALEGIVLPIGDYKGYGIALMVEILAGVLTGADFSERMVDHDADEKRNVGHLFIAVETDSFMNKEEYKKRINELVQSIKQAPVIPGQNVYLPGEIEWQRKQQQLSEKINIPEKTLQEFWDLCEKHNIS